MSRRTPTRPPSTWLLLPLLLLGGCAHQPPARSTPTSAAIPNSPAAPDSGVQAGSAAAPGTPAPSPASAAPPAPGSVAASPAPAAAPAPATAGASDLPGPPAGSLVVVQKGDLWDRLRSGFQLQDVEEPAVDAQLNWFANHPDFLQRTFGRAELWMYYIVGQLEQRNMPRELALLPVIESAFEPYAYSRARAAGLWQFVSDTGRRFGLKQDWWYDGRRDPIEATRAALDYLQALHDEFNGDWLLAIAAYNCGELAVERAVARNQALGRPTDFWHLKLPTETRGYVPELLAMRRLVLNPGRYGLEFSHIPNEPYFVPINTGGQINLQIVAEVAGISTEDLYTLNPAFHRFATDPTGPYRLLVPVDASEGLEETLRQLTPDQRMGVEHYTVQHGDTVASIAAHFNTRPEMIRELNDLGRNERPVIDADLRIPSSTPILPEKAARAAMLIDSPVRLRHHHRRSMRPDIRVVRRGETLYGIAQRLGTDVHTLAQANGIQPGDQLRVGQRLRVGSQTLDADGALLPAHSQHSAHHHTRVASASSDGSRRVYYRVRRGDTLYSIARTLQVTVVDLVDWNRMSRIRHIRPGQTLVAFVHTGS